MAEKPEGMVSVSKYAQHHQASEELVIAQIKEGTLQGRLVDGDWYVSVGGEPAKTESASTAGMATSNYPAAIVLSYIGMITGWAMTIAGGVWAARLIDEVNRLNKYRSALEASEISPIIASAPAFAAVGAGLSLVITCQIVKAVCDNADNTRKILEHLRGE